MAICIAYLGVGAVAIPTGIISAGFVEQYQRKSSLSNIKAADIHEIAEIFVDKRFAGKSVEEMEEANRLRSSSFCGGICPFCLKKIRC